MRKGLLLIIFILATTAVYGAVPVIINNGNSIQDNDFLSAEENDNAILNISTDIRADVYYRLNGSNNVTVFLNRTDGFVSVSSVEGDNQLAIYAYNPANHAEVSTLTLNYDVDLALPTVNIELNSSSLVIGESILIKWNASDDSLDSYKINVSEPDGNVIVSDNDFDDITIENLTEEGTYRVKALAKDTAGNVKVEEATFEVGNPGSTVTLKSPASNEILDDDDIVFYCNASDESGVETITLYNNLSGDWSRDDTKTYYGKTVNFTRTNVRNGEYIWNCKATDQFGGESFASNNITFFVDDNSPSIGLVKPLDDFKTENTWVVFNISVSDDVDKELLCNLTINDEVEKKHFEIDNDNSTQFNYTGLTDGNYTWYVECVDDAGNLGKSVTNSFEVALPIEEPEETPEPAEPKVTESSTQEPETKEETVEATEDVKTETKPKKEEKKEEPEIKSITEATVTRINKTNPIYVLAVFMLISVVILAGLGIYFYTKDNIFAKIRFKRFKNKVVDNVDYVKYRYRRWKNRPY